MPAALRRAQSVFPGAQHVPNGKLDFLTLRKALVLVAKGLTADTLLLPKLTSLHNVSH